MPNLVRCYACEFQATTREHAPPRALFPEQKDLPPGVDLRKELIVVPSCDRHNSQTSKDDEYLMWILSLPLQGNKTKQDHFETKAMRAYRRRPDTFFGLLENLTPVQLEDSEGVRQDAAAFMVDIPRFDRCMWKIAVAIFHVETGERWLGGYRVFSDAFVEMVGPDAARQNEVRHQVVGKMYEAFGSLPAKGSNPEVFTYRFVMSSNKAAVLLSFYDGIRVVVLLSDA